MSRVPALKWVAVLGGLTVSGSACTLTVNGGDGGSDLFNEGDGSDSGLQSDTTTEAGATAETSTTVETGTITDGADGSSCAIITSGALSFASAACDMCAAQSCCNEATACFGGTQSMCDSQFSCFGDCLVGNPDAGVPPGTNATCKSDCGGVDGGVPTFNGLVDCLTTHCGPACL